MPSGERKRVTKTALRQTATTIRADLRELERNLRDDDLRAALGAATMAEAGGSVLREQVERMLSEDGVS